ncbi:MAG: hypothetical protein KF764_21475 [Labilithrix sp.]|nr:hypothetical protein [Labilithrix sp.]MBX3223051.1 hypothetical protein [Labilithrix sp.]
MKLSLITAATLTALALGCGVSDEEKKLDTPPPADPAPAETAPVRKLVDGPALSTSPVNLLADPGFSLVGRQQGYGSFLAFYDGGSERFELATTLDSRSPAGFGGAVALVRPAKATDKKSQAVTLLTSFLGGSGPFHVKVWVSKSNVAGEPVDLPTDGSAVKVSVMEGSPDSNTAFDLVVDPNVTRTAAGRTWVLLRGDIPKPLANGGFFVVRTGTKGGHIHIAAPEITSDELTVGQAVKSRSSLMLATARTKDASERLAIRAYQSMPPRLVPAAPKAELLD